MILTKIVEKKWTYILYKADEVFILSVMCGGVGLFEISVCLSNQVGARASSDVDFLEGLADEISNDPRKYLAQSVSIKE